MAKAGNRVDPDIPTAGKYRQEARCGDRRFDSEGNQYNKYYLQSVTVGKTAKP
ncbi:MAG: hypothetical protein WC003_17520 [Terrimicrobiaceae bacterium]